MSYRRRTQEVTDPVEQFGMLWGELNGMLKKQEETQAMFNKVEESNMEIAQKLELLQSKWTQAFGHQTDNSEVHI